jgi:hypothetical protein
MASQSQLNIESRRLSEEIVNEVREKIKEYIRENPGGDPWDEEDGGAAWLDNEVGMATEFLQIINTSIIYPKWDIYDTVQIFQEKMATLVSESDLKFIIFFIIEGGTGEIDFFELRKKSKKEILDWFKKKGFAIDNEHKHNENHTLCKVCRKQGKMKKCSTCLQAYYCSIECQQNDWKKHKKSCKKILKIE